MPVEVHGEEERRLHNDARRFARLLISEIKLYNEAAVRVGRENRDQTQDQRNTKCDQRLPVHFGVPRRLLDGTCHHWNQEDPLIK